MLPRPPLGVLQTPGFAHYSLAWSPFIPSRFAVASSANYGLVGNGRLHIVSLGQDLHLDRSFDTQDGLYDLAWSEIHENQVVVASGDGSLKLFDITLADLPIRLWREHSREVFSVDWSNIRKDQFVSSSWDGNLKVWTPEHPKSLTTLHAHPACSYQALFSPHEPDTLASCSSDGTIRLFDLRAPVSATSLNQPLTLPQLTIPASTTEILSIDWNKYLPWTIASAGVDKSVRIWDCRMIKGGAGAAPGTGGGGAGGGQVGGDCTHELRGHEYAVRKIQWSPHRPDLIASAGYDMSCRIWTTNPPPNASSLVYIQDAHTEFVSGCSWSLYEEGLIASCSWDFKVLLFRP